MGKGRKAKGLKRRPIRQGAELQGQSHGRDGQPMKNAGEEQEGRPGTDEAVREASRRKAQIPHAGVRGEDKKERKRNRKPTPIESHRAQPNPTCLSVTREMRGPRALTDKPYNSQYHKALMTPAHVAGMGTPTGLYA